MDIKNNRIDLVDNNIIRTRDGQTLFEISISEIKVIGEYTNDEGPYHDDWFLTILTNEDWYEIPMYLEDFNKFLNVLGEKLETKFILHFANSTNWKSRIIYPEKFADQEIYKIEEILPQTFLGKLSRIFGRKRTERKLSEITKEITSDALIFKNKL